jgi:hypothetical protein
VFALAVCAWAFDDDQDLFQQHRWFDLRETAVADRYAEALIKGAVALAFNHPAEAELQLKRAVRLAKRSEQADAARDKLVALFLREGRTVEAARQLKTMLKRDPMPRPETQGLLELVDGVGDSTVRIPKGGVTVPCEVKSDGVWLGLTVNGKKVSWLLDTGANFSTVSQEDSEVLGIARAAERVSTGGIEFHNLPVLKGKRSVAGLPFVAAMQTFSWKRDGTCRAGFVWNGAGPANLAFDDFNLVVRGTLEGKPADFVLDTGQTESQTWGKGDSHFDTGGLKASLKSAKPGNDFQQGLLGMDALRQADEVVIDFRTMTLAFRLLN